MDYRPFISNQLAKAAEIARPYQGKVNGMVKEGDNNQVLTEADLAVGNQLVAAVQAMYPDHNIIDEEAGVIDNGSEYTWVIDPIEATSSFAVGTPQYGIMIGLLEVGVPIAGGIFVPASDTLYLAQKGEGATRNGETMQVTAETDLMKVLVSYGIDGYQHDPERTKRECGVLADIILGCRNMRNSGCEAIDPMYVAEGRYGARIETTAKIWDCVAPHIITEEAGAVWTTANGNPLDYTNPISKINQNFTFCVASPALHKQLQAIIAGRLES